MKKCPYCGAEYPDEATVCAIDTQALLEHPPKAKVEPAPAAKQRKEEPVLLYPDYQWRARDAWKCIGIMLCLGVVLFAVNHGVYLLSRPFYRSGFGDVSRSLLHYGVELLTVAYFARTQTLAAFWKGFGLGQKPTNHVWFGIVMVLIIRTSGHYMIVHHWGSGVHNYEIAEFRKTMGWERFLFLVPIVVFAPLFEEPVYRGFLYKAFRGSFGIIVSMFFIMVWVCNTHWSQYSQSWIAGVDITAFNIVLCYLRERSPSLWDCIICHFVFNASSMLPLR